MKHERGRLLPGAVGLDGAGRGSPGSGAWEGAWLRMGVARQQGAGRISSARGGGNRKSRHLSAHAVGLRGVTGKCATSFWIVSIFSVH